MRRAADVNDAFDFIRCCVDERYRIRCYRYHRERLGIRRVTETVHEQLSFVERTQRSRYRIAESDHAKELVFRRLNYRNRIGSLVGRINAIVAGDWNVWPRPGRLLRERARE